MARKVSDRSPRLKQLEEARRKVGRSKLIVNLDEMATIVGLSTRSMQDLVKEPGFPVQRHGSTGISYELDAAKVLDHMIAAEKRIMAERDARSDRIASIARVQMPREIAASLPVSDLRALDSLQTSLMRKRIEQGDYTRTEECAEVITTLFTILQSEILASASRLDPAGRWPPGVRPDVQNAMRSALVDAHKAIEKWLKPDAGPKARNRGRAKGAERGPVLRQRA